MSLRVKQDTDFKQIPYAKKTNARKRVCSEHHIPVSCAAKRFMLSITIYNIGQLSELFDIWIWVYLQPWFLQEGMHQLKGIENKMYKQYNR